MIQYWLQNDSNTISLRLDDRKSICLTDGFAVKDYVGEVEMVKEVWTLLLYASEHDVEGRVTQLMGLTEKLNHAWRTAVSAIERQEAENMVWLYQRRHGVERRVLLGGGQATVTRGEWPSAQGNWVSLGVEVLRHPLVEDVQVVTVAGTAVNCTGGVLAVNQPGNLYAQTTAVSIAPARLAETILNQPSGAGPTLDTIWLGIHPSGTTALSPIFDLATYGARLDGGVGSTISFATNGEHQLRMRIAVTQNTGDIAQLRGRWRVLLRAKTSGGSAPLVNVQLAVGQRYTNQVIEYTRDYINTNGEWQLLEMGEIDLPPEGYTPFETIGASNTYAGTALFLLAGCENTSMSLQVDRFILIPARYSVKCTNAKIAKVLYMSGSAGNWDDRGLHIRTMPNDDQHAILYDLHDSPSDNYFYPRGMVGMEPINWQLPPEGGVLVIAASRTNGTHDNTDTVDVRLEYHARHYTL